PQASAGRPFDFALHANRTRTTRARFMSARTLHRLARPKLRNGEARASPSLQAKQTAGSDQVERREQRLHRRDAVLRRLAARVQLAHTDDLAVLGGEHEVEAVVDRRLD